MIKYTEMLKKLLFVLLVSMLIACSSNQNAKVNSSNKIEALLKQMTIEEKAGQLNLIPLEGKITAEKLQMIRDGKVGNVLKSNGAQLNAMLQKIAVDESRLGIPILFQEDVIHGYKTIAPIPLAEAASWDLKLIQNSAAIAAREAAAAGIHLTYAPMVDVSRNPRWGRILEAAGEDPYLGSKVAEARVKGFQESNENANQNILACVKHFVGYGASIDGRDYTIADFSERELREIYLPPFQAAIDAGVASLMCAYSAYDGVPLTASRFLLHDVLRNEMGFEGLIMTDWSTIKNLLVIGMAENDTVATKMAIDAGIDMDMTAECYVNYIPYLVQKGLISEKQVDDAVRQVLKLKEKVGLFDDPYAYFNAEREAAELFSEANYKATKEIALKSMVLLKNEDDVLPLKTKKQTIAVIGPLAKAQKDLLGWWACMGDENQVVSIYDAISKKVGDNTTIKYAKGCDIDGFKVAGKDKIKQAVQVAQSADVVLMVLGEEYWMSGEGGGTASLHLPSAQEELLQAVAKTGKPIVTIIVSGRPYVLTDVAKNSNALLEAWMPGSTGGEAVADILFGDFNPCGKLPVTFPYHEGQVPIFYNYRKTSHGFDAGDNDNRYSATYRDIQNEPLYPFGYGLSYTHYTYGDIELSANSIVKGEKLIAKMKVTNTGKVKGSEIVQLYIHDVICSVSRPVIELKDFTILELEPGETKEAIFEITSDKLEFIDRNFKKTTEPGEFKLFIGESSANLKETTFSLN